MTPVGVNDGGNFFFAAVSFWRSVVSALIMVVRVCAASMIVRFATVYLFFDWIGCNDCFDDSSLS